MSFSNYKNLGNILKKFQLSCYEQDFLDVEAKKDNFQEGWGQCLVELIAAQKLNHTDVSIFGIVSNGDKWEFAKLEKNKFIKNKFFYTLQTLPALCGALENVLLQCELQLD